MKGISSTLTLTITRPGDLHLQVMQCICIQFGLPAELQMTAAAAFT